MVYDLTIQPTIPGSYICYCEIKKLDVIWFCWRIAQSTKKIEANGTLIHMKLSSLSKRIGGIIGIETPHNTSCFSLIIV